jgi:hypothetical protein
MKSNVLIKVLSETPELYDWLEVDLNTYKFFEGNSVNKNHSNHYNLAVCVSKDEYRKFKSSLVHFNEVLYGVAN